eukprot:1456442-Rhodomonas_salina.1
MAVCECAWTTEHSILKLSRTDSRCRTPKTCLTALGIASIFRRSICSGDTGRFPLRRNIATRQPSPLPSVNFNSG